MFQRLIYLSWIFVLRSDFWNGRCFRHVADAFPSVPPRCRNIQRESVRCFNVDPSLHVEEEVKLPEKQYDKNGQEFMEGQVVRICKEGLKAYQVPAKGKGSYDGTTFVADPSSHYLALPVGLRGVVMRVIDTKSVSANFPVRVKFEPNVETEEGYSAPVSFLMHFLPQEVEII